MWTQNKTTIKDEANLCRADCIFIPPYTTMILTISLILLRLFFRILNEVSLSFVGFLGVLHRC
jgi:hypothetical protein|eukprot:COSAG06_NODE_255_length_19038_cov_16.597381_6_plen_63_part_00